MGICFQTLQPFQNPRLYLKEWNRNWRSERQPISNFSKFARDQRDAFYRCSAFPETIQGQLRQILKNFYFTLSVTKRRYLRKGTLQIDGAYGIPILAFKSPSLFASISENRRQACKHIVRTVLCSSTQDCPFRKPAANIQISLSHRFSPYPHI